MTSTGFRQSELVSGSGQRADNVRILERLNAAWSERNVDGVRACFHPEGQYASSLLHHGSAQGPRAIGNLAATLFDRDQHAMGTVTASFVADDYAWWTWRYEFADRPPELGCDLFQFTDGLITMKDAYRKVV